MLIIGDISGIQEFVFALPEDTAGQARMLRARSFYLQALTEVLAWRVQLALDVPRDTLLFCAAGRFAIHAPDPPRDANERLAAERMFVEKWLLQNAAGSVRFSLAWHSAPRTTRLCEQYEALLARLQREKARPWASAAISAGMWHPNRLILEPSGELAQPERFQEIGKALPRARWFVVTTAEAPAVWGEIASFPLPAFRGALCSEAFDATRNPALLLANLHGRPDSIPASNVVHRPLARHVPLAPDGHPLLFEEIASRAVGPQYLGVLKMDADSLGVAFQDRARTAKDLKELAIFSASLDNFFAVELDALLRTGPWQSIYTVFSGGDDLLLVGPWDLMLQFAGEVQTRFMARFGDQGLTISGGLALVHYRHPIRRSAQLAEDLLDRAKTEPAPRQQSGKNQLAALGQVWKWKDHTTVLATGKRVAGWVEDGWMERGWLHVLLDACLLPRRATTERTRGDRMLIEPRLTYHVTRNYPSPNDAKPERREVREWADHVVAALKDGEQASDPETAFLPAILRYALLATRSVPGEEVL